MAAEKDASCHSCTSDPNFAIICSFLNKFAQKCGIVHPTFAELQEMLEDTTEVSQQLVDLHIKLMRKAKKTITAEKWERALAKFCHSYSSQDGWELERFGYKKSSTGVKLRLMKTLLEAQFDLNSKFKMEINKLSSIELRCKPLGRDVNGQTYWCQFDPAAHIRIYKENPEEETWEMIAKDRFDLVNLIDNLSSGEGQQELNEILKEGSNSPSKPIIDTGQVEENISGEEETDEESSRDSIESVDKKPIDSNYENTREPKELITVGNKDIEPEAEITSNSKDMDSLDNCKEKEDGNFKLANKEEIKLPIVVTKKASNGEDNKVSSSTMIDEDDEDSSSMSELHEDSNNAPDNPESSNTPPEPKDSIKNYSSIDERTKAEQRAFEEEEEFTLMDDTNCPLDVTKSKQESIISNGVHSTTLITSTNGSTDKSSDSSGQDYGMDLSRKSAEEVPPRGIPLRPSLGAFKKSKTSTVHHGSKLDEIFKNKRSYNLSNPTNLPPQSQPLQPYMVGMNHKDILSQMSERFNEPMSYHAHHEQRLEANIGHSKRGPEDLSISSSKRVHLDETPDDPIVGEAIEEPMMLIKGVGSGHDCDMGNPGREADTPPDNASTATSEVCNKVPDNYSQSSSSNSNNKIDETDNKPLENITEKKTPKLWSIDTICSPEKPTSEAPPKLQLGETSSPSSALFFFGPGSLKKTVDVSFSGETSTDTKSLSSLDSKLKDIAKNEKQLVGIKEPEIVSSNCEIRVSRVIASESSKSDIADSEDNVEKKFNIVANLGEKDSANNDSKVVNLSNNKSPSCSKDTPKLSNENLEEADKPVNNTKFSDETIHSTEISGLTYKIPSDGDQVALIPEKLQKKVTITESNRIKSSDNCMPNGNVKLDLNYDSSQENRKENKKIKTVESSNKASVNTTLKGNDLANNISEKSSDSHLSSERNNSTTIAGLDCVKEESDSDGVTEKENISRCKVVDDASKSNSLVKSFQNDISGKDSLKEPPANSECTTNKSKSSTKIVKGKKSSTAKTTASSNKHRTEDIAEIKVEDLKPEPPCEEGSENKLNISIKKTKTEDSTQVKTENDESADQSITETRSGRRSRTNSTCGKPQPKNDEVPSKIRKTKENSFNSENVEDEKKSKIENKIKLIPLRRTNRRGGFLDKANSKAPPEKDKDTVKSKRKAEKTKEPEELNEPEAKEEEPSKKTDKSFSLSTFSLEEPDEAASKKTVLSKRKVSEPVKPPQKRTNADRENMSRKRRGRKSSQSEDDTAEEESEKNDAVEGGGKRPRLRGKSVRGKLATRQKAEEQRAEKLKSSSEEEDEEEEQESEEDKDGCSDKKKDITAVRGGRGFRGRGGVRRRGGGVARRGRGRGSHRESTRPKVEESSPPPQPPPEPEKMEKSVKKRAKKAQTLMGLLECDLKHAELNPGADGSNVRQSRRIAQIKLKEQAERRAIEEATMLSLKELEREEKRKHKDDSSEKKKPRKNSKAKTPKVSDCDYSEHDISEEKRKVKKKRKHKNFRNYDISNPWRSSSSSDEEDEEEDHYEDDEDDFVKPPHVSDHEFSPESDLEKDDLDSQPMRMARTAQKDEECEDVTEEYACQKCNQLDHPEWILLCDKCDNGWHASCLRPPLMVIPEGDWFCPPCQHNLLVVKLKETLRLFQKDSKRRENEELRRKRLAYIGISLANVLPEHGKKKAKEEGGKKRSVRGLSSSEDESSSEESESTGIESSEEEPVYQLRQRRAATNLTYRLNEFDDLINSAIQDEMEAVKGVGNQGRGKDIATIVNAEKEEKLNAVFDSQGPIKDDPTEEPEGAEGWKPPVVPRRSVIPSLKKKSRKLNCLDVSSGDDADSDEDFKGSSDDEEEEEESLDDDSDASGVGGRWKRSRNQPVRRSTRARVSRIDSEFINDDSDESDEPRKKKKRHIWHESESEDSDATWGKKKRRPRAFSKPKSKSKKKKGKKFFDESDSDAPKKPKIKKPKIRYGLSEDDDDQGPRTRGKVINYQEVAGSDTEEEVLHKSRVFESEEEFVLENEMKESLEDSGEEKEEVDAVDDVEEEEEEEEEEEDEDEGEDDEAKVKEKGADEDKEEPVIVKKPEKVVVEAVKESKVEPEDEIEEEEDEEDEEDEEEENNLVEIKPGPVEPSTPPAPVQIDARLKVRKIEELEAEPKVQPCRLRIKSQADLQGEVPPENNVLQRKIVPPFMPEPRVEEDIKPPVPLEEKSTSGIRVVPPQKLMAAPIVEEQERLQESVIRGMMVPQQQGFYNRVDYNRAPRMYPQQQQVVRQQFTPGGPRMRSVYHSEPLGGKDQRYMYTGPPQQAYHQPTTPGYYQQQHYPPPAEDAYSDYSSDQTPLAPAPMPYDDEGEFGGLVSYFSSQREDNLDT